jgi:hypothetical protein
MSCECDYDNAPQMFTERKVKCRKPAKCCECHTVINCGDEYVRTSGMWDYEFSTMKTCLFCADLRNRCDLRCCGYGDLSDGVHWALQDNGNDVEALAFFARVKASKERKLEGLER